MMRTKGQRQYDEIEDEFKSGGALVGCLVGFGLTMLAVLAVYVVMIVLSAVHK